MGISKETREHLTEFLNEIRDYIEESGNNLVNDDRGSSEFVDIYCTDWVGEKADYTSNNEVSICEVDGCNREVLSDSTMCPHHFAMSIDLED